MCESNDVTFDVIDMVVDVGDGSDIIKEHSSSIYENDADRPKWSEPVRQMW